MKQGYHGYSAGSEVISTMTPSFDYYYQNPQGSHFLMQSWAYYGLTCSFTMVNHGRSLFTSQQFDHG